MSTFYTNIDLEELVLINHNGFLSTPDTVVGNLEEAQDNAWGGREIVLGLEIGDPDIWLGMDWEEIDHQMELMVQDSIPVDDPEDFIGVTDGYGEPITWEDPVERERAIELWGMLDNGDKFDWRTSMELFGTAALLHDVPFDQIGILTPVDAAAYESKEEFMMAANEMEPVAFKTLGASFWAWLIMFMASLVPEGKATKKEKTEAERKAKKRRARRARRSTRKKKKAPRKRKKQIGAVA